MQESKTHDLPDRTLGSGTLPSPEAGVKDRDVSSALRKLDLFLLPAVTLIYFLNFLDRCVTHLRRSRSLVALIRLPGQIQHR